jgi:hypothetical protein
MLQELFCDPVPEEGGRCLVCDAPGLELRRQVGTKCTCHTGVMPCDSCLGQALTCPICGWSERDPLDE